MAFFLVSDIHGCYNEFEELLGFWNKEDTLVLLGDYIDRGPDSLKVLQKIIDLKNEYGEKVIALRGNHDDDFSQWLSMPSEEAPFYYLSRFKETIFSFYEGDKKKFNKASRRYKHMHINYKYKDVVRLLKQMPYYHETEHCIFVHAGFNLNLEDWKDSKLSDFIWIRDSFYEYKVEAPKKTFFGHTPVAYFHHENKPYHFSKTKVGIDGGCVFGGALIGLRIDKEGNTIEEYEVPYKQ